MRLTLAERFLLTRRRLNLTQAQLGRMLEVCARTVRRVERAEGGLLRVTVERFEILESRQRHKQRQADRHKQTRMGRAKGKLQGMGVIG